MKLHLPLELLLILHLSPTLAAPLTARSTPFTSLTSLTPLPHDLSAPSPNPQKYFTESLFHPHYDGRFAALHLPPRTRALHIRLMVRAYMHTMRRAGVRTWLMHGSLLGWWWNGAGFPWDSDVDVCVEEAGMGELGAWWNMTVHAFSAEELGLVPDEEGDGRARLYDTPSSLRSGRRNQTPDYAAEKDDPILRPAGLAPAVWTTILQSGKKYLLEVNPHAASASPADIHNAIDARWIDVSTGLFIDITTVHRVPKPSSSTSKLTLASSINTDEEEMYTKDTHLYTRSSLFPLRASRFEGTSVLVPYAYATLLEEEYSAEALVQRNYGGYVFDVEKGVWVVGPKKVLKGEDKKVGA